LSFVFSQEYNAIRVRSERAFISLFSVYEEEGREKSAFGFEFEFFFENEDLNIPRQLFLFLKKKKRMMIIKTLAKKSAEKNFRKEDEETEKRRFS
jgi:hypothetical protein